MQGGKKKGTKKKATVGPPGASERLAAERAKVKAANYNREAEQPDSSSEMSSDDSEASQVERGSGADVVEEAAAAGQKRMKKKLKRLAVCPALRCAC